MNTEENKECFVSCKISIQFQLFSSHRSVLEIQGMCIDALPCLYFKSYKM